MKMHSLFDLTGRVALVTGGSKGLGKAMARGFAEAGADVVISSRHEDELVAAKADIHAGTGVRIAQFSLVGELDELAKRGLVRGREARSSWAIAPTPSCRTTCWSTGCARRRRRALGTTKRGVGPCYEDRIGAPRSTARRAARPGAHRGDGEIALSQLGTGHRDPGRQGAQRGPR